MSAEHANATAYRRAAEAFRARELNALTKLIAADVVWHIPGGHARDIRGLPALIPFLETLASRGFWLEEHDVLGSDDHVCALSLMGLRRGDIDVTTRVVSVFHYRNGQQVERWFYPEDPAVWDILMAE